MKIRSGFVSNSSSSSFIVTNYNSVDKVHDKIIELGYKNRVRNLSRSERYLKHTQFYTISDIESSIDDNIIIIFYDKTMSKESKEIICNILYSYTMYGFTPELLDSGYTEGFKYSEKDDDIIKKKVIFSKDIIKNQRYIIVATTENYLRRDFYNDFMREFKLKTHQHLG